MFRVGVEGQFVGTTGGGRDAVTLQFGVHGGLLADVGVTPDDHVFVLVVLNLGVLVVFGGHVRRLELDVVMISQDRKGTFEQRVNAISPDHNTGPTSMLRNPIFIYQI